MSTNSGIEWTEATWNPIAGCTPVSSGCLHCYAATMSHRLEGMGQEKYRGLTVLRNGVRTFNGQIHFDEEALLIPLRRRKPTVYFVNSMSDLFHKDVPFEFIDKVFAVMALCPQHTFQVLTKRPKRMAEYLNTARRANHIWQTVGTIDPQVLEIEGTDVQWPHNIPINVWLGTSVENQQCADERIPHLLKCPAAVRFLSCEPLLSDIVFNEVPHECTHDEGFAEPDTNVWVCSKCENATGLEGIDWVIVGGESGPKSRACEVAWIRSIVGQCKAAGVACFVKQLGANPTEEVDGGYDEDGNEFACRPYQEPMRIRDKKGGDIAEWPSDLCVRQMPQIGGGL